MGNKLWGTLFSIQDVPKKISKASHKILWVWLETLLMSQYMMSYTQLRSVYRCGDGIQYITVLTSHQLIIVKLCNLKSIICSSQLIGIMGICLQLYDSGLNDLQKKQKDFSYAKCFSFNTVSKAQFFKWFINKEGNIAIVLKFPISEFGQYCNIVSTPGLVLCPHTQRESSAAKAPGM